MKNIFKIMLFNHGVLVSETEESLDKSFAARYILASSYGIRITKNKNLVTSDMVPFVADEIGENVPESFYRGFPDSVKKLSPDELIFDQILQYFRTYDMGDFETTGHSIFETAEDFERSVFCEKTDTKEFIVLPEAEAELKLSGIIEDLLSGTRPINDDMYLMIGEYIITYNYRVQNCRSKNLAVKFLIRFRDTYYTRFLQLSDVVKFVDELNYFEYGNRNAKKLNLKNKDRKFITEVIHKIFEADNCDIFVCFEKKAIWSGLLHHIHFKAVTNEEAEFVSMMRGSENFSAYSAFEAAMSKNDICSAMDVLLDLKGPGAVLRNLTYIVSRCESEDDVSTVVNYLSAPNAIVLMQLLINYSSYEENASRRTFTFSKYNLLRTHVETDEEMSRRKSVISKETADILAECFKQKLKEYFMTRKIGKVYIDPEMVNVALPIQENTSSSGYGILPKGTRIHLPEAKKIRAFTYWEKVNDIDLSVIGITDKGTQEEYSWRTMRYKQSEEICYSGDETSGYHGGSEFFDVDISLFKANHPHTKYLVFCNNVYSSCTFNNCVCRAGYMIRDEKDSGDIYEPKTVKSSFTINCDSTFAYLFAIDLEKNDFIWLNVSRDGYAHVAGTTAVGFLKKYFNLTDILNYKNFFEMLATEVVCSIEEADVVVTDKNVAVPDKEIIRSYDIERVMALMNLK